MFSYRTAVRLHHTDAAGLLFFADQFKLAHDAYETFMESVGFSFSRVIDDMGFLIPIVHAEADFKAALSTGDPLVVEVRAEHIGNSSYTLGFELKRPGGELVGTVKTIHVWISKSDRRKRPLDDKLRQELINIAR